MPYRLRRDSSSSIGEPTPEPSAHGGAAGYLHPDNGPVLTHACANIELKGEVREREHEGAPKPQSPTACEF